VAVIPESGYRFSDKITHQYCKGKRNPSGVAVQESAHNDRDGAATPAQTDFSLP